MEYNGVQFQKVPGHWGFGGSDVVKGGSSSSRITEMNAMASCAGNPLCNIFTVKNDGNDYNIRRTQGGRIATSADRGYYTDWYTLKKIGGSPKPAKYTGALVDVDQSKAQGGRDIEQPCGDWCPGFNNFRGNGNQKGFDQNQKFGGCCPESFEAGICPTSIGTSVGGKWVFTDKLKMECQYSGMNWPTLINAGIFNDNLGKQFLTPDSWIQAKNDYCVNWDNIDKGQCVNWLQPNNPGSSSYNSVKLGLCASQADWTTDTRCVNAINQVFKTGSDSEKNMANQMVNLKCGTNPASPACACYNATNRSVDDCLRTPELPGCKSIADKVGKYKSMGATFMTTALRPFCACDECTQAKTGSAGKVISQPAADQPGLCAGTINTCFQTITVGSMTGGTLAAGCTIKDINTPPPPPSGGGASPPPPPPSGMGPTTAGAAIPPSGGGAAPPPPSGTAGAPPPPSGTAGSAGAAGATSAAPDSKKGLIMGLGFGGACLCLLFVLIAIFFVMKKKVKVKAA